MTDLMIPEVDLVTRLTRREQIAWCEQFNALEPQIPLEVTHVFSDGLYSRTMRIPKGTLLTGAIHRRAHLSVVLQGRISVYTETGTEQYEAPCLFSSPPGTKRVGYAHTDTIWVTVHATQATTVKDAEAELIVTHFED